MARCECGYDFKTRALPFSPDLSDRQLYWREPCRHVWLHHELSAGVVGDLTGDQIMSMDISSMRTRKSEDTKQESVATIVSYFRVMPPEAIEKLKELLTASTEHCPKCGGPLSRGTRREVANLPRLLFLVALIVIGVVGVIAGNTILQVVGFGVSAAYFFLGIVFLGNLRWIFTRWILDHEPHWYATRRFAAFRRTFLFSVLRENLVALGVLAAVAIGFPGLGVVMTLMREVRSAMP